jgi:hypothetical protein
MSIMMMTAEAAATRAASNTFSHFFVTRLEWI